jgi:hypothetical protein
MNYSYGLWEMGVKMSHMHCVNQGGIMQQKTKQGMRVTISKQTLSIGLCVCINACAI